MKQVVEKLRLDSGPRDMLVIVAVAVVSAILAVKYEAFERLYQLTYHYDEFELDEILSVTFCLGAACMALFMRRSTELRREIGQRKAAEAEARSLARHDALTGLPNRRVLGSAIERAMSQPDDRQDGAALLIDLDRFKPVNDIHGHALGDAVLCVVAERLKAAIGRGDTLARIGGDEFAAVVRSDKGSETAMRTAERMITAISEPILVDGIKIEIGATIGIALCRRDGGDAESLLRSADLAMYRAKRDGRGTYASFESSMDAEIQARAALEADLRKAIAQGEIKPHYQPLVSLADIRLIGFEVLARWNHPVKGAIEPAVFIPLAEDTGLIGELSVALLRQACLDARSWPSDLILSVNIAPGQLSDRALPQTILGILTELGFPPGRLEVEITENALVSDLEAAQAVLASLHHVGVRIALDDFGTGYSSLSHLRDLHFDKVKLDRSFVQSMDDPESAKIVKAVIGLGKSLGLPTTAEGIENADHLEQLRQLDCDVGQGYHLGKAMPAAQVLEMLAEQEAMRRPDPLRLAVA